jgi:hypothetical protein
MGRGADATTIFDLLADDYSRQILVAADTQPRTAKDLSDVCDSSLATIYRRVSTLQEHNLLEEYSTVDADGSHRRKFETTLEELHVEISDGELELSLTTRDDLADNFTALWSNLRDST